MQIIFATTDGNEKIVGKYIKKKIRLNQQVPT